MSISAPPIRRAIPRSITRKNCARPGRLRGLCLCSAHRFARSLMSRCLLMTIPSAIVLRRLPPQTLLLRCRLCVQWAHSHLLHPIMRVRSTHRIHGLLHHPHDLRLIRAHRHHLYRPTNDHRPKHGAIIRRRFRQCRKRSSLRLPISPRYVRQRLRPRNSVLFSRPLRRHNGPLCHHQKRLKHPPRQYPLRAWM